MIYLFYHKKILSASKNKNRKKQSSEANFGAKQQSVFALTSDCAGDLTGAQATSASIYSAGRAVDDCLYSLNIGFPGSVGTSV